MPQTVGTEALEDVVDAVNLEIAREGDDGDLGCLETEGASAALAVEVGVHVIDVAVILAAMAVGGTHRILEHARSVVDSMNQVMGQEERDGAVDSGLVHRV